MPALTTSRSVYVRVPAPTPEWSGAAARRVPAGACRKRHTGHTGLRHHQRLGDLFRFSRSLILHYQTTLRTTFRSVPQRRARQRAGTRTPNAQPTLGPALTYRMAESALATFVVFLFRCFVELMRLTLDFVCLVLFIGAHDLQSSHDPSVPLVAIGVATVKLVCASRQVQLAGAAGRCSRKVPRACA